MVSSADSTQLSDAVRVLRQALDQAGDVLDHVHADEVDAPTPCGEWDVATLADHLVAAPSDFRMRMHGEQPPSSTPHVTQGWGVRFRNNADDLIHAWHGVTGDAPVPAEWQTAEIAVHTWDLARALGRPVDDLDPEVATTGLAFMRANLRDDQRDPVFGPEQPAPEDAGPYDELAAFAGRKVR
jgi:uncharacterized protein (TIGR03086 family)